MISSVGSWVQATKRPSQFTSGQSALTLRAIVVFESGTTSITRHGFLFIWAPFEEKQNDVVVLLVKF
jgi:hypothetical protein